MEAGTAAVEEGLCDRRAGGRPACTLLTCVEPYPSGRPYHPVVEPPCWPSIPTLLYRARLPTGPRSVA